MARKPPISDEDRELWHRYSKSIRPLHPRRRPDSPETPVGKKKVRKTVQQQVAIRTKSPPHLDQIIDPSTLRKIHRGRLAIDGSIDLHGMRQVEAHEALRRFLLYSSQAGRRCVLVITGKGGTSHDGIEARPGILRRKVPQWLQTAELAPLVIGVEPAHQKDGGDGALYVLLRRARHTV